MWRNSRTRYGAVAAGLHWTIAGLVLIQFWLGPYMASLPETDASQFPLFQLHKSIGLTVLALMLVRLLWRATGPVPELPSHMRSSERIAAHLSHGLLYALAILVPLAGWATVSATPLGIPTMWFGLFEWPHLSFLSELPRASRQRLEPSLETLHAILAFTLMALVALHIAAALKHHFGDKDAVLKRMLPWTKL